MFSILHPHFGAEGEKARFCGRHKTDDMVNVKHRRCQQPGCRRERLFTEDPNTKPLYCSLHLAYQQRGIDPRSCDLELPPGLMPLPPPGGGRSAGVGGGTRQLPGAGLLPGLNINTGRSPPLSPGMHHRLQSGGDGGLRAGGRKRGRLGIGEDDGASDLSDQQLQQLQQQQQGRRIYDTHPHRQAGGGGGGGAGGGAGGGSGGAMHTPATAFLPPAPPMRGDYEARGFVGLSGGHGDGSGVSGVTSYRANTPGMSSVSGFVDPPVSSRAPMATVGGSGGGGGAVSGVGSGNGSAGSGSRVPRRAGGGSVHPGSSPVGAASSYASWPVTSRGGGGGGGGGPTNSTGVSVSVSTASGASSSCAGAGSGVGGGGGGGDGSGGDEANPEVKPLPTEPPVHGPLYQYTGRGTSAGGMSGGHGPSASLAHVRLPVLGWVPSASPPPLLPGISNFGQLSAAAAVIAETPPAPAPRPWTATAVSTGASSQQQRAGGQDASGVASMGGQGQGQARSLHGQSQGQEAAAAAAVAEGVQGVQQLLDPGWGNAGSASPGFQPFGPQHVPPGRLPASSQGIGGVRISGTGPGGHHHLQ
eukprot:jgi/Undpi1/2277/HiC_scaffold_13.g05663.m1